MGAVQGGQDGRLRLGKYDTFAFCGGTSCGGEEASHSTDKPDRYPEHTDVYADVSALDLCGAVSRGRANPSKSSEKSSAKTSYFNLHDGTDRTKCDMLEDEGITANVKKFDFDSFGAIPHGWVKSLRRPPDAFYYFGGSALVIERESEDLVSKDLIGHEEEEQPIERRVLLALPETYVDLARAKWLSRRPAFTAEARCICHLCRVRECKATGHVVFEFGYPAGVSVSELLKGGHCLSIDKAQALLYQLLALVTTATFEPLRLYGFIDPTMVFLDREDNLQAVVPLGCLLSFVGIKATLLQVVLAGSEWSLAPEIKCAVLTQDAMALTDAEMASITDSYAAALLVIRTLGQEFFDRSRGIQVELPELGRDMLVKVLHHESEWRLSGTGALSHPWMKEVAPQNNVDC